MAKPRKYASYVCSRCTTCCRVPLVPVTDSDVARLCAATGLAATDIIRFYSPQEMEYDADSGLWIKFRSGKRSMGLRKKGERCMFLNEKGLCSVYEYRPMTCRTFPYDVTFADDGKVKSIKLNKVLPCQCTRVKEMDHDSIIIDAEREYHEDEAYFDKVALWNDSKPRGLTRPFLKFLDLI